MNQQYQTDIYSKILENFTYQNAYLKEEDAIDRTLTKEGILGIKTLNNLYISVVIKLIPDTTGAESISGIKITDSKIKRK